MTERLQLFLPEGCCLFSSGSSEVLINDGRKSGGIGKVADVQSKKEPLLPAPFAASSQHGLVTGQRESR